MTNVCMKFEKAGPTQTLLNDPTSLYMTERQTDQATNGQTDAKQYTPLFFERGYNYNYQRNC